MYTCISISLHIRRLSLCMAHFISSTVSRFLAHPCSQGELLRSHFVRPSVIPSVRLLTLCSAYYSSETTHGIVMKLHTCIGTGLEMVLNEICSDRKNKMAARQPFWIFNNMNYHIIEKSCSARYSSETTDGTVMKLHTCIRLGL